MKKNLPISIVIPSYNRAPQLRITLPLYLSLPVEKIILVDDCSTDGTELEYAELDHPKFLYYRNPENLKQPGARNKGVELSTSKYLIMGEDDVYMAADYVESLYKKMIELRADFIAGRMINMNRDETYESAQGRAMLMSNKEFKSRNSLGFDYSCQFDEAIPTPYLHACSIFRRDWAVQYPYCGRYRGNGLREESHFYLNAYRHGAKMYYESSVAAYHMFHDYEGGCRGTHLSYAYSGVVNTHKFLNVFWDEIQDIFEIKQNRLVFELIFTLNLFKSTFKHWISMTFPNLHKLLKKLKEKS
ncbi:Glycosyl transferase [Lentisphaera araneosa HTCC2155]|uniref:Glycosyl transferase n=1 Tax=Lentisphaera araneosa HTCC2155 TaxID=313628 RepID=A6DT09_9BACT|nr:glycosyltransferase family 2 protein [Lentisphaera araneosa]EDM25184.1 Glycosyl transferase [Lentisphaera araneosa HTCC2155]